MPEAVALGKRGRDLGIENRRGHMKVASRQPIMALDDRAALKYLDLSDSDSEASESSNSAVNQSVSQEFYKGSDDSKKMRESGSSRLVDQRLIELLEKLPKNKRISLRT